MITLTLRCNYAFSAKRNLDFLSRMCSPELCPEVLDTGERLVAVEVLQALDRLRDRQATGEMVMMMMMMMPSAAGNGGGGRGDADDC
jgi:hypothetical protein